MTEHIVDYSDAERRWECSCGYTAKARPAVVRHARAANTTQREATR